jgi:KDO2-lipid IV(A) lauroyltransferase
MLEIRTKHRVEYALLRAIAAPLSAMPYRTALTCGWFLAISGYHLLRKRSRVAEARIQSVFPDLPESEIRRVAWTSWRNIVFNAVELTGIRRVTPGRVFSLVDCDAVFSRIKQHTDAGRGAVVAVPHTGNWDLAGIACHMYGIPVFSIAARQKNPLVNDYLNRLRSWTGMETLERGSGTMKSVLLRLRSGGVLAILPDVRIREAGIEVPFLGGRANVGKGLGMFAHHAGIPVFPCFATRDGWQRHKITMAEPILPDTASDAESEVHRITGQVMAGIDKAIRERPEQWFWFNKRWVLDPVPGKR